MSTLKKVNLNEPVEFLAYRVDGIWSRPVDNLTPFVMPPATAQGFINALTEASQLDLILESLQSLAVRNDGVKLQTAMPGLTEFKSAIQSLTGAPEGLTEWLGEAEILNANEVTINFVEAYSPKSSPTPIIELPERPKCSNELLSRLISSYGLDAPEEIRLALKGLQLQAKGGAATLSGRSLEIKDGHALLEQGQRLIAKHNEVAQCIVNFAMSRDTQKSIVEMNDHDAFALLLGYR